jgi:hypothetical protein
MNKQKFYLSSIVGMLLLCHFTIIGCNPIEQSDKETDFFGVNLDENDNQVKKLHDLLLVGKVKQNGKVLKEWADAWGTEYSFSEGKVVSFELAQGEVEKVSFIRDSLNTSFSERFTPVNHFMMKEWVPIDSKQFYFEYLDLYEYRNYTLGVNYRIISPTRDKTNIKSALLIVSLGNKEQ